MSSGEFGEPRLIHSPGFIQLCSDKSGEPSEWAFLSSGTDGDAWLWGKEDLDEADYTPQNLGGRTHNAIAWHSLDAYIGYTHTDPRTGIEKAVVSKMNLENFALSSPIATFSLDVTSVDVSKSGSHLAVGAVDHVVKVVHINNQEFVRLECEGQILCVSFDPREELLAASASDGKLYAFKLPAENSAPPVFTSRLCSRITDIDPKQSRLQLCWSPDGEYLFAPALGGVKKFKRDFSQDTTTLLTFDDSSTEVYSVSCTSPCGQFVAATTLSGFICVWQVSNGSLVTRSKYIRNGAGKVISSMVWHGFLENTIVFADTEEHLCSLSKCARTSIPPDTKKKVIIDDSEDNDTRLTADLGAIKKAYGFNEDGSIDEDFVTTHRTVDNLYSDNVVEKIQPYKPPTLPKAFISGAAPDQLSERYLKWNRYGVITRYSSTTENSIEITWHDASVHSSVNLDNFSTNYTMGDLSNELYALATKGEDEVQSELYVCYVAAWDQASREWKIALPLGESIEDIAIGVEFVAVFTSHRCFRTYSHGGTQRIVVSYPGILSTTCAAYDHLAVATYNGGFLFEEGNENPQYNMTVQVYKINLKTWFKEHSLVESWPLATGRNSTLQWMGYSKEGELCTLDSKCCLRILTTSGVWMPIYNFSGIIKSPSDGVWPVSVVRRPEPEIRYLYSKGTQYPLVASRPAPLIVKWQIPLCNSESEKSQLEENLLLAELRRSFIENSCLSESTVELQELLTSYARDIVRLFAFSCKADRECRAAELAWLSPNPQVLQSLCNFAAKTRHTLLSEKVAEIGRQCSERLLDEARGGRDENSITLAPRRSVKIPRRQERKPEIARKYEDELRGATLSEDDDGVRVPDSAQQTQAPSFDLSLASEVSCRIPLEKSANNPFKRKLIDSISANGENLFDALATPEQRATPLSSLNAAKKTRQNEHTPKQSLLSFSAQKSEKKRKTGFELWLTSVESVLKTEHEGRDDDFTKFATKKFRSLSQEEKQDRSK